MIGLPAAPGFVQSDSTTRDAALKVSRAFLRAVRIVPGSLTATLVTAVTDSFLPGAYGKGEAVWSVQDQMASVSLIVPYRAAYVVRYDDARSFGRPRRLGWNRGLPAAKARGVAIGAMHALGASKSWRVQTDSFGPGSSRSSLWPSMAIISIAEWPGGLPVIGAGNSAQIQFEPGSGVIRWFSIRKDARFVRPKRVVSPAQAARVAGASGQGSLVWDARDLDLEPRLAYRFRGSGGRAVLVDAGTGRLR